ncbi:MAG: ribonuclease P protein component [Candidatus Pacebacteria bacterium]|nr:ribonuclease P protein component [Candidatus Paceibacterota bacterium]
MLAKKYRLPIQTVLGKGGKANKSRYFLLKVFLNDFPFNRFGVIISKKVAKNSSDRNRIKRLIFNNLQKSVKSEKSGGKDFLIIVSPQIMSADKEEVIGDLKILLK